MIGPPSPPRIGSAETSEPGGKIGKLGSSLAGTTVALSLGAVEAGDGAPTRDSQVPVYWESRALATKNTGRRTKCHSGKASRYDEAFPVRHL